VAAADAAVLVKWANGSDAPTFGPVAGAVVWSAEFPPPTLPVVWSRGQLDHFLASSPLPVVVSRRRPSGEWVVVQATGGASPRKGDPPMPTAAAALQDARARGYDARSCVVLVDGTRDDLTALTVLHTATGGVTSSLAGGTGDGAAGGLSVASSLQHLSYVTALLSHSLRTPLTGVLGGVDALQLTLPRAVARDREVQT
jgi:signal transduction histidine kinase